MGSGFFNTLCSVRMEMEGFSPSTMGLVISSLYLGILFSSAQIDKWVTKVGHVFAFVSFALTLSLLSILQGIWVHPFYWAALRFVGGGCTAGIFIVIESWFLIQSSPERRGIALSIYLAACYIALSLGQFLLDLSDPTHFWSFCLVSLFLAISIFPITGKNVVRPVIKQTERLNSIKLLRLSPLGSIGSLISGMLLSVVYG